MTGCDLYPYGYILSFSMNFVSITIYRKAANMAITEGLPREKLSHHNIELTGPPASNFVSLEQLLEIYELAYDQLKPGFPIRLGGQMDADDYGTLGLSWKTAWKAQDIFERTVRYIVLITNRGTYDFKEIGLNTEITMHRDVHRLGQALSNEATFAMYAGILRSVTGTDLYPQLIRFKHKAHRSIEPYVDYFKCEVRFGEDSNSMSYLTKDLLTPTIKADQSIHRFLLDRLEEEKNSLPVNSNQVAVDVEKLIKEALPSGIPSIVEVSEHMGMSNRTLTRRLSESGFTFRDLIKKTQEVMAKDLLQKTNRNIAEIAFETGFSEQSAFNRAFKRWTGKSPVEFRKM